MEKDKNKENIIELLAIMGILIAVLWIGLKISSIEELNRREELYIQEIYNRMPPYVDTDKTYILYRKDKVNKNVKKAK